MERKYIFQKTIALTVAIFLVLLGFILMFTIGKPIVRGFHCNDRTIMEPYKKSTISAVVNIVIGLAFFLVTFLASEIYRIRFSPCAVTIKEKIYIGKYTVSVKSWIIDWAFVFLWFLLGLAIELMIVEITKLSFGALRPNFRSVCNATINNSLTCNINTSIYIAPNDYVCNSHFSIYLQNDARKSFMSNHAASIAYMTGFSTILLFFRWPWKTSKYIFILPVFVACIAITFAIGFTRILDNKHHLIDIITGIIFGFIIAVIFVMPVRTIK
ncbi:hypothetical protein GJ496_011476 [Pomphorhynchus laevis]|nr:hypothetical protein GJ496_011476 [Pomphorhynchus laevis]